LKTKTESAPYAEKGSKVKRLIKIKKPAEVIVIG